MNHLQRRNHDRRRAARNRAAVRFFSRLAGLLLLAGLLMGCSGLQRSAPVLVEDEPVVPTVAVLPSITPTPKSTATVPPTPVTITPDRWAETALALVTPTLPPSRTPTPTSTATHTPTATRTPTWTPPATQTPFPTFTPLPVIQPTLPPVGGVPSGTSPGSNTQPAPVIPPDAVAALPAPRDASGGCVHGWFFSTRPVSDCPVGPPLSSEAVFLNFERGMMVWIAAERKIYVLYDDGQMPAWERYPDTWYEGLPERDPAIVGPAGLWQQPRRGFGHLWRSNGSIRARLGWALAEWETPFTATLQQAGAEGGASLFIGGLEGAAYELSGDQRRWERFTP